MRWTKQWLMIVRKSANLTKSWADVESDDPSIYDGTSVAVQLVGRRLQEEKVLTMAEYIGKALGELN